MKLAAITCLYGVREIARQRANYWACAAALKAQGVDLWTVQGLLPWQYHAEAIDGERMLWVPIRDFLWHKERLLTIGVQRLPDAYDAVLWVDADVTFDLPDIRERIEQVLEKYAILQPWSDAIYHDEAGRPLNGVFDVTQPGALDFGRWLWEVPQFLRRSAAAVNWEQETYVRAHTGLAWAARREWFDQVGLYEYSLGGNGDETLCEGCWGVSDAIARANYSRPHWAHVLRWIARCYDAVRGQVGYVPGTIRHLWHGPIRGRGYRVRQLQLRASGFDPEAHLIDQPGEALVWSDAAPGGLVAWMREYFGAPD